MKSHFIFCIFLISISSTTFSQEVSDSFFIKKLTSSEIHGLSKSGNITHRTKIQRYEIYYNNVSITAHDAVMRMEPNAQALILMKQSIDKIDMHYSLTKKLNRAIFPVSTLVILSLSPKVPLDVQVITISLFFGSGIVFGVIQMTRQSQSYKLAKQAAEIYNSGIHYTSITPQSKLSWGLLNNGIGMRINF